MKLLKLYIENFMCYDSSYIDFTQFNSALIVGKIENNDLFSNGVGKTTIFKAIEYVLFNQSDVKLENIIRDDEPQCRIVLDFLIGEQEYRVSRIRTKKGATDLTLLQRNSVEGIDAEVYHKIENGNYIPYNDKINKYWTDISGSRAGDTEKDLAKLIKLNPKSFRSTIHFLQNDIGGLSTATPEKRKLILREAFQLALYAKLEKIAKDKSALLSKEIEKHKVLIENLGDPLNDLENLSKNILETEVFIKENDEQLIELNKQVHIVNDKIKSLTYSYSGLEEKFSSLLLQEKNILSDKSRINVSLQEFTTKKSLTSKNAKDLIEQIETLKNNQKDYLQIDFSPIQTLIDDIGKNKENIFTINLNIKNNIIEYEELKIPLPDDNICKHCRQTMTKEHRAQCQTQIKEKIKLLEENNKLLKEKINDINKHILNQEKTLKDLQKNKSILENISSQISEKEKEIQNKKVLYKEYNDLCEKFIEEIKSKDNELNQIKESLKNSSIEEAELIKKEIEKEKEILNNFNIKINEVNKKINHYNSNKAVIQHTIDQKTKDNEKKIELSKNLSILNDKYKIYPTILKSFSSAGIPNLIIQNVLDDLQAEANNLLSQLKPGLQLSFFVEKVKDDGTENDTLDISYHVNGKPRYYEQLSGAMKMAVMFSLKLGLAFLLQKMTGMDCQFLLLDEVDQSLDKGSVDAFADIVKFFQKDFTILIITHNDRLKDKFQHTILVEQDLNMVSRAKVVSSW